MNSAVLSVAVELVRTEWVTVQLEMGRNGKVYFSAETDISPDGDVLDDVRRVLDKAKRDLVGFESEETKTQHGSWYFTFGG